MLNRFDWLRRSRSGAELLATLQYFESNPKLPFLNGELGPAHTAFRGACQRCWVYPRMPLNGEEPNSVNTSLRPYCKFCQAILNQAKHLGNTSRRSTLVWGITNQIPRQLRNREGFYAQNLLGVYIHDKYRWLMMLSKWSVKDWIQDLVLHHGHEMRGLIQILPTTGPDFGIDMGDILARAEHHEVHAASDQLSVRFYVTPYQVLTSHSRERQGNLTFEIAEFLRLLEMAAVFRVILRPEEQEILRELLTLDDSQEELFYWGRLLGELSPEARDMLSNWRIRTWPETRLDLLYELRDYVYVDFSKTP